MAKPVQPKKADIIAVKRQVANPGIKSVKTVKSAAAPATARTARPFPIVAIGASAGGLEALELFLRHVPADCGMAFVVIQHLDPNHKGMMPELLQRATAMPVAQAKNRMKVQPGCVYVIPPNRDLSILHDCLYLLEPIAPHGLRLPIDFFFRSLAEDRQEQAIGVILSGMGSDGTLGLRAIKERGGLVLVQDPTTARFDSMPRSVIEAGLVDIMATADELPLRIADYVLHFPVTTIQRQIDEVETEEQTSAFDKICILLRNRTGHDFSLYKKSTVYRRIERRMTIHQLDHISNYVHFLRENTQEIDLLFKELLIGVTRFFRDPVSWACLQERILPDLLAAYPMGAAFRAWVAGCSTGEEAYTLAIAFREVHEKLKLPGRYSLQIFATDLDPDAIAKARQGFYPANIAADVSEEHLRRYFVENDGRYQVGKEIREMVVFAPHNLIMDPPFTKLDIVTCRNLLIYLGAELQKKLLPLFHYSLNPGGTLMLGSAESIGGFTELFEPLDAKMRLFRRSSNLLPAYQLEFPTRHFPTRTESIMVTKPEPTTDNLQNLADQLLLQQFSPTAVLVTGTGDLLYISGRTGKYLEPAAGKVNWNIHAMAREGLRHELSLALPRALRDNERAVYRNLRVSTDAGTQVVDMTVQAIKEPAALRGMVMVVFTDVATTPLPEAVSTKSRTRSSQREAELERVLAQLQQQMQTLREEMQTSQEELKSTNEELQSTNEELQSTNEELTTSKEEMQSLNEELQTVNLELQSKVDELSSANNDMKNLLNSTDIATIFLNNALHVRRFTTQATRLFKLIPSDVGRPLSDIVTDLVYHDLLDDAEEVLRTLVYSDKEIATSDGRWFQVKIMPYRTLENVIDGVVITFNDIGRAKTLEAQLRVDASNNTKE
ncbi:MAG: chemotaxis protein CheB [Formivibrio sp.]|nr:chemotaxis protein CheB [Formivibrio sp.]